MHAALSRYNTAAPLARLGLAMAAIVMLSGLYCLAYRYSVGDPATLAEAFGWGVINLAPWVAAIELGRHLARAWHIALLVALACGVSLLLGAAHAGEPPNTFELVRRLPAMALTCIALAAIDIHRRRRAMPVRRSGANRAGTRACDWARAAGNYVEINTGGGRPMLVRSTLSRLVEDGEARLIRVHRSFAVAPSAIAAVERAHVLLRDGTRLPIGNAYRGRLDAA